MTASSFRRVAALTLAAGLAVPALAQDSVSTTPGTSDALDVYNHDNVVRYVVDLVPLTSSWGNAFRIAPIMKASADNDPLFTTQLLSASAVSPDQLVNLIPGPVQYRQWNAAGAGMNPVRNTATGGTVGASSFTRQFGVAFSDFASLASNVWGATIGQSDANPDRLFVTRTLAAASRGDEFAQNSSTPTLGAIDASGNLFVRADNFLSSDSPVQGENIVRVNLPARGNFLSTLYFDGLNNVFGDSPAATYILNNSTTTTNVPASIPASLGSPIGIVLDFANNYRPNGGAGVTLHLASGIGTHRGNPSFSTVNNLGGVGTVASLARPTGANPKVNSLNLFAVSNTGTVIATRGATMPASITDGQGFTANASGNAEFLQYLSQTSFRGGSGQVGVGFDPLTSSYVAAATATDAGGLEYIALARFGGTITWTVPAYEGKAVLDGPSGTTIGTIRTGATPISISAPAVDRQGNVYFVAAFQPTVGSPTTALIKSVNTPSGYRLERLLQAGQSFTGANSTRTYTIDRLTLGDSDSIASGSFFSGNLLQPSYPNQTGTGPSDPRSFGGVVVNASITYNNGGTPETYQAVLFVGPSLAAPPSFCTGDADGNRTVSFSDITAVLANFGTTYPPLSAGAGDANNDGSVDFSDITTVLANFGTTCP
jgi:hypothetical protein